MRRAWSLLLIASAVGCAKNAPSDAAAPEAGAYDDGGGDPADEAPPATGAAGLEELQTRFDDLDEQLWAQGVSDPTRPQRRAEFEARSEDPETSTERGITDRRERICSLQTAICDLSEQICGLAEAHQGEARYAQACARSEARCSQATEACDGA